MNYCMECGKPTDNGMICEDCMVNNSPWLLAMKIKENDLEQKIAKLKAENDELKEAEHRAEVAEKMFDILHEESSMYMKVYSKEWYKQQAEKELAEERKDEGEN